MEQDGKSSWEKCHPTELKVAEGENGQKKNADLEAELGNAKRQKTESIPEPSDTSGSIHPKLTEQQWQTMKANREKALHRKAERDACAAAKIAVSLNQADADFESEPEEESVDAFEEAAEYTWPCETSECAHDDVEDQSVQVHKRMRLNEKTNPCHALGYPQRKLLKKTEYEIRKAK